MNALAAIVWDPVFPLPVIAGLWLVLASLAVWTTWRCGPRLPWWRRAVLCTLRLTALALLCLPLLQPSHERTIPRHHAERLALIAVDTSQSMAEKDAGGSARLDAARALIRKHQLFGQSPLGNCRLFQFDSDSRPIAPEQLDALLPSGDTTLFDTSLGGVLNSLGGDGQCVGLFVFTDGHDFEGVPPSRLGKLARQYRAPIYPIPLGRTVQVPDVSLAMISAQPSTFVKQKSRLEAAARFRSCGARLVKVELLRAGEVVREQRISSTGDGEVPVGFDVSEDEPGQYEYEIRCAVQADERDAENNTAFTYLNVTDARIPVLLVEGEPHWDTSFLQRTLTRNDRMSLDTVSAVGQDRLHTARSDSTLPKLEKLTPKVLETYPVIILGRSVDKVLGAEGVAAIAKSVSDGGQTVLFVRGRPGDAKEWEDLSPAPLGGNFTGPVSVAVSGARGSVVPLEILRSTGRSQLPELPAAAAVGKPKTLASVEARAEDSGQKNTLPAMLLRQHGAGQVFAVALDGLWKWSLHPGSSPDNNVYDRFWNQLLLNLIARSSRTPSDKAQLTVARANLTVGEQVVFTLRLPPRRDGVGTDFTTPPSVRISRDGAEAATVQMNRPDDAAPWMAMLPAERAGRFRAEAALPSGEKVACRFGVSAAAKETTDVSTDLEYLRQLATASSGRVLDEASLSSALEALTRAAEAERAAPPAVQRTSLWDNANLFWILCGIFGADWFFRRRWGLV